MSVIPPDSLYRQEHLSMCWVGDRRLCHFSKLATTTANGPLLTDHDADIVPAPLSELQRCDFLPNLFDRLYRGDLPDWHGRYCSFVGLC
jgi:hypothetical protein